MPESSSRLADLDRQRLHQLRQLGLELRHFYDVGASTGKWSTQVAEDFPEAAFDLFEPLADFSPTYQEQLEATVVSHPRFCLHKVAVGAQCKRTLMHVHRNLVGSTALEMGRAMNGEWQRVEVDMWTLDHVVKVLGRPMPQVVKIDTQGCELSILKGAQSILPEIEVLLIECWLVRGYGQGTPLLFEISDWLSQRGFYLWDLGGEWRDSQGVLVSQDCFFLNARSKLSRLRQEFAVQSAVTPAAPAAPPEKRSLLRLLAQFGL
jgi:FkbM family methyltransferase